MYSGQLFECRPVVGTDAKHRENLHTQTRLQPSSFKISNSYKSSLLLPLFRERVESESFCTLPLVTAALWLLPLPTGL